MKSSYEKLKTLKDELKKAVKGQDWAIDAITSVLIRGEMGFANPGRPKGSFLFVGPTGTGKTELTKAFSKKLFPKNAFVRFDMSEFMTKESLGYLIGEGKGESGIFGRKVDGLKEGVLLFDEMEKAHPSILDLFLQILDEGHITLRDGRKRDLFGWYVVFTSNIGSSDILHMKGENFQKIRRIIQYQLEETLRPEMLARIQEVAVFNKLSFEVQREICEKIVASEVRRLGEMGYELSLENSAILFLLDRGYSAKQGARPMRDAVEKFLGDLLSQQMLNGEPTSGTIKAHPYGKGLYLEKNESSASGTNLCRVKMSAKEICQAIC